MVELTYKTFDDDYFIIDLCSNDDNYEKLVFDISEYLLENFAMICSYTALPSDMERYLDYFKQSNAIIFCGDSKKFFMKKMPSLLISINSVDDLKFISSNWNGSFESSNEIYFCVKNHEVELFEYLKVNSYQEVNIRKNKLIECIIQDGQDPDNYKSTSVIGKIKLFNKIKMIADNLLYQSLDK